MKKPEKNEQRKPTKTISGVAPVAVMLPPRRCNHGECVYCPNLDVPQSYTPKSPVVMRASNVNYDSYKQVIGRIKAFKEMNHPTDKVEIIVMGGTFLQYPKKFQYEFIKGIYDALNSFELKNKIRSKNLQEAKRFNENAKHRCVALCLETRPDNVVEYIDRMREFGCTRVELGVQIPDDKIYKKIERGHSVKDVVEATKELKKAGFKIGYHLIPGLPGSNLKKDLMKFKKLFKDERFKPDQIKIYPCQVMPNSKLEKWFYQGKYKTYTKEEIKQLLKEMLKVTPRYCRIMRMMREIPPEYIVSGTVRIDLRKEVEEELRAKFKNESINKKIKEIRFREIGFALQKLQGKKEKIDTDLKLKVTKYSSSLGEEYFLEIVNKNDVLFGLLRLRLDNERDFSMVRELHVYGKALEIHKASEESSQHKGLGKRLMDKAEEISSLKGRKKVKVISGAGVRGYYKRLGYNLESPGDFSFKNGKGEYMVKFLR